MALVRTSEDLEDAGQFMQEDAGGAIAEAIVASSIGRHVAETVRRDRTPREAPADR